MRRPKLQDYDFSITRTILEKAKAFLCWDVFTNLSVQLIELNQAAGYFFPSSNDRNSIVLFYRAGNPDFSGPLFMLFHEAGHILQYEEWDRSDRVQDFHKMMDEATGHIKTAFEKEAWDWGRDLLRDFIDKETLPAETLERYDVYTETCLQTYQG